MIPCGMKLMGRRRDGGVRIQPFERETKRTTERNMQPEILRRTTKLGQWTKIGRCMDQSVTGLQHCVMEEYKFGPSIASSNYKAAFCVLEWGLLSWTLF